MCRDQNWTSETERPTERPTERATERPTERASERIKIEKPGVGRHLLGPSKILPPRKKNFGPPSNFFSWPALEVLLLDGWSVGQSIGRSVGPSVRRWVTFMKTSRESQKAALRISHLSLLLLSLLSLLLMSLSLLLLSLLIN